MEFTFYGKEDIAKALKKLIEEDLDKVAFEKPFSNVYLYRESAIEEDKRVKAMKINLEGNIFYIF